MVKVSIKNGSISLFGGSPIRGELLLGGDDWTCAMHRIDPTMARKIAADLIKAADTLEPPLSPKFEPYLKIERWLTADDLSAFGVSWQWWSNGWGGGNKFRKFTAIMDEDYVVMADEWSTFYDGSFEIGDYFMMIMEEAK